MLIILMRPDLVGVNGVFYHASLEALDPRIQMLQYDTELGRGRQFFTAETKIPVSVRDLDAERKLLDEAVVKNLDISKLQPIHKSIEVHRPDEPLENFNYEAFYVLWLAAKAEQKKARDVALAAVRAAQPKAAGGEGTT